MCDSVKAVVIGNFIILNGYVRKEKRLEIKYAVLQFKKLKEQTKHRKEMIKIRAEINEMEKTQATEKTNLGKKF